MMRIVRVHKNVEKCGRKRQPHSSKVSYKAAGGAESTSCLRGDVTGAGVEGEAKQSVGSLMDRGSFEGHVTTQRNTDKNTKMGGKIQGGWKAGVGTHT
jgi:hypothetical protein